MLAHCLFTVTMETNICIQIRPASETSYRSKKLWGEGPQIHTPVVTPLDTEPAISFYFEISFPVKRNHFS